MSNVKLFIICLMVLAQTSNSYADDRQRTYEAERQRIALIRAAEQQSSVNQLPTTQGTFVPSLEGNKSQNARQDRNSSRVLSSQTAGIEQVKFQFDTWAENQFEPVKTITFQEDQLQVQNTQNVEPEQKYVESAPKDYSAEAAKADFLQKQEKTGVDAKYLSVRIGEQRSRLKIIEEESRIVVIQVDASPEASLSGTK